MNVQSIKSGDKYALILKATVELIAKKGFYGTPISAVAKKAGVSVGIIYHYFKNKDDLIKQVNEQIMQKFANALLEGDSKQMAHKKRFLNLWKNMINYLITNPAEHTFIKQFSASPYAQSCYNQKQFEYFTNTIQLIEAGIKAKALKPLPVILIMETTFALSSALIELKTSTGMKIDESFLTTTAQVAWDAIAKHENDIHPNL